MYVEVVKLIFLKKRQSDSEKILSTRSETHGHSDIAWETPEECGSRLWMDYHRRRKVMTLDGLWQFKVVICQCHPPLLTVPSKISSRSGKTQGTTHGEFGLEFDCSYRHLIVQRASQSFFRRCINAYLPMVLRSQNEKSHT